MKRKMPPEHHTGAQRNAQVSNCNCTSVVCSGFASATGAWEGLTYRKIFRRKAIQQEVAALLQHLLPASPFPQRTPLRRQHVQSDLQVMIPPQLQPNLHTMSSIRCIDNKHNHMTLPHRIQVPWRCRSSFSQGCMPCSCTMSDLCMELLYMDALNQLAHQSAHMQHDHCIYAPRNHTVTPLCNDTLRSDESPPHRT